MAEYVKFRLSAAKVGVTMALAALIAGAAERAGAGASTVHARPAALFIKLGGIRGELHKVLSKIEIKIEDVGAEVGRLEAKMNKVYTKVETDRLFMKTRVADAKFLHKAGTAANSQLLGNKPASAFVQGNRTSVMTGAGAVGPASTGPQTLLQIPSATQGGIIVVCEPAPAGSAPGTQAVLENKTGETLPAVQSLDGQSHSLNLGPGSNLLLGNTGGAGQTTIQILPTSGFSEVVTLVISAEPSLNGDGKTAFVAQAFTGGV